MYEIIILSNKIEDRKIGSRGLRNSRGKLGKIKRLVMIETRKRMNLSQMQ